MKAVVVIAMFCLAPQKFTISKQDSKQKDNNEKKWTQHQQKKLQLRFRQTSQP